MIPVTVEAGESFMTAATIEDAVPYERSRQDQAWARWLARSIDSILIIPIVFAVFMGVGVAVQLGRLPADFIAWTENPLAATVVEIVVTMVLFALWEPLFLSNTSTTPGKWIMGVSVRREDGRRMGLFTAIGRFFWIWAVGLGLFIPLVALICMLIARSKLIADGVTAWDQGLKLEVTHKKRHPALWVVLIILVLSINIGVGILTRMPA
jgi:uncharacterized RDD family membrane protein YckC